MQLPQKFYIEYLVNCTSYRPNWLPDKPLRIGDIGKLEDGIFTLYTTLEQQHVKFTTRESSSSLDFDYSSTDSMDIGLNISSNTANNKIQEVIPSANITISFKNNKGVLFQMTGSKKVIIENLNEIETTVLQKYQKKEWPKEWVIITEIIIAEYATIIISTSQNNKIELASDVPIGFVKNKLADPSLNLRIVHETGSSTKIIGAKELTPLFQVKGIYKPFLNKPQFRKRADTEMDEIVFEELNYDERELME